MRRMHFTIRVPRSRWESFASSQAIATRAVTAQRDGSEISMHAHSPTYETYDSALGDLKRVHQKFPLLCR
jgi:hypothetical protein